MKQLRAQCLEPIHKPLINIWVVLLLIVLCCPYLPAIDKELLVILNEDGYGYIDHDGNIVIRPQYVWAEDFQGGFGVVFVCGRYVSVDASGNLHPLRITTPGRQEPVKKDGKYGFVDAAGVFKIPPAFEDALSFSDGYAAVKVGDKWGFIDAEGEMAIKPEFEAAYYFLEGVANVTIDSETAFIDTSGNVIARGYSYLRGIISQGRIPVTKNGKGGYLDLKGKVVIPLKYDWTSRFSDGLAAVKTGDKWGYIDLNGEERIPFKFDNAGEFSNGLAPVKIGEVSGFIDQSGSFAFQLPFRSAPGFLTGNQDGLFIAPYTVSRFFTEDYKFGYVNTSGKVIWGPVEGTPDHTPLIGWSEEMIDHSCKDVPEEIQKKIAGFPKPGTVSE